MGSASKKAAAMNWPPVVHRGIVCFVNTAAETVVEKPWLQVREIQWRLNSEGNTALIDYPKGRFGDEGDFVAGQRIAIYLDKFENESEKDDKRLIFTGRLWGITEEASPNEEVVTYVARDYIHDLKGEMIYGQLTGYDSTIGGPHTFEPEFCTLSQSKRTVYNPTINGVVQPNYFSTAVTNIGTVVVPNEQRMFMFESNSRPGVRFYWHSNYAIRNCYNYWIYRGREDFIANFDSPNNETPCNLVDKPIRDIDVTMKNIPEAFDLITKAAGYEWYLQPVTTTKSRFVCVGTTEVDNPTRTVYLPPVDAGIYPDDVSKREARWGIQRMSAIQTKLNTNSLALHRDWSNVYNVHEGIGGARRWQITAMFTFEPGWSKTEENAAFGIGTEPTRLQQDAYFLNVSYRNQENDAYETHKNVGRRYILNETGDEAGDRTSQNTFEFTSHFTTSGFVTNTQRPFLGELASKDSTTTEPENYYVEYKYSGESTWNSTKGVKILPDVAGVFISSEEPLFRSKTPEDPYVTDQNIDGWGMVRGKFVVEGDDAAIRTAMANYDFADGAILGGLRPSFERRLIYVFDNEYVIDNMNAAANVTTKSALFTWLGLQRDKMERWQDTSSVMIPWITNSYGLYHVINKIMGRNRHVPETDNEDTEESEKNIALSARIIGIDWKFDSQITELLTEDDRMHRIR